MSDVTWWKKDLNSGWDRNSPAPGREVPGDEDASDIVGRTGEEMPDVAHDDGSFDLPITPVDGTDKDKSLPPEADEFER